MPGEQGFISALDAPIVNLALAAVVVALIVVVLMAVLYVVSSRQQSNNLAKALEGQAQLLDALMTQGNQQGGMLRALEQNQQIQREQSKDIQAARQAIESLDEKTAGYARDLRENADSNHKSLLEIIEAKARSTITDIIGETRRVVDEGAERIINLMQPALEPLGDMRITLNKMREDEDRRATARQAQLDGMEAKIATAEHNVVRFMNHLMEELKGDTGNEQTVDMGGSGADEPDSDRASGSTGDSGLNGGPAHGVAVVADPAADGRDRGAGAGDSVPAAGTGESGQSGSSEHPQRD